MTYNTKHLTARIHYVGKKWIAYVKTDTNEIGFGRGETSWEAIADAQEDAKFHAGFARLALAVEGTA